MLLQADIFSFGVIIWEVIAHETPIRARLRELQVPIFPLNLQQQPQPNS